MRSRRPSNHELSVMRTAIHVQQRTLTTAKGRWTRSSCAPQNAHGAGPGGLQNAWSVGPTTSTLRSINLGFPSSSVASSFNSSARWAPNQVCWGLAEALHQDQEHDQTNRKALKEYRADHMIERNRR